MITNQVKAGAILNYVIIGLNILTGLLYTPYMLRCLGQNEYGLYSLVASVIAYLTLLDFGFGSAIVRYTVKIRKTGSKDEEWRLYGMFFTGYTLVSILIIIGGIFLYCNVDRMFDRTMTAEDIEQAKVMMVLMIVNMAVSFPFSIFGSIISAYEKFVFQRIITISRILLSTGVLIAVLSMGYRAIALVIVQTIFSFSTLTATTLYCKYKLNIKIRFNNFNFKLLKEIMIFSWWNFLTAIIDRIYWSTGQFILGMYCGTISVAIYSLAIMLMNLYMSMSTSLNSVLLPRLTALATHKENDKAISNIFVRTGRLQFCVLALILSAFIVFGKSFINLWAGHDYGQSYIITLMFFIALLVPLIQNVGITILLARGQMKFRALCYLAIALCCLVVQVILSKKMGALGCAIATSGTLILGQWIIMNIYYKKRQAIDIGGFWVQILKMAVTPAILTIIGVLIVHSIDITSWMRLFSAGALYILLYLPAFWMFSMNDYERSQITNPLRKLKLRN